MIQPELFTSTMSVTEANRSKGQEQGAMRYFPSDKPCDAAFQTIYPARHAGGVLRYEGLKNAGHPCHASACFQHVERF